MTREDDTDSEVPRHSRISMPAAVVDGTFLYWLLGALPLSEGRAWRLPTWSLTSEGLDLHESGTLRVVARTEMQLEDGVRFEPWIIEARSSRGTVNMWVVDRPPYLLRQEIVTADGETTSVLELKAFRRTP